jgi:hypothetical protein
VPGKTAIIFFEEGCATHDPRQKQRGRFLAIWKNDAEKQFDRRPNDTIAFGPVIR